MAALAIAFNHQENSSMATKAQINANRDNAQKSSGPKTAEGKARSCLNHVSHGFTSSILMVKDLEDREEFDGLLADLTREFQPATPHEQILVEKMVFNQWNSLRAIRLQSLHLTVSLPRGFISKELGLLIRYQTTADRAYHKAHAELLMAQKERKKSGIGFESNEATENQDEVNQAEASPQEAAQQPVPEPSPLQNIPDFTPFDYKIADELGMDIEELRRAV
jgi:hypothetical protein